MPGVVAAFIFGFLAGIVLLRLGSRKPLSMWEQRWLRPLGWVVMSASFTLAAVLFAWSAYLGLH
jgi:hypothetical protein